MAETSNVAASLEPGTLLDDQFAAVFQLLLTGIAIQVPLSAYEFDRPPKGSCQLAKAEGGRLVAS